MSYFEDINFERYEETGGRIVAVFREGPFFTVTCLVPYDRKNLELRLKDRELRGLPHEVTSLILANWPKEGTTMSNIPTTLEELCDLDALTQERDSQAATISALVEALTRVQVFAKLYPFTGLGDAEDYKEGKGLLRNINAVLARAQVRSETQQGGD